MSCTESNVFLHWPASVDLLENGSLDCDSELASAGSRNSLSSAVSFRCAAFQNSNLWAIFSPGLAPSISDESFPTSADVDLRAGFVSSSPRAGLFQHLRHTFGQLAMPTSRRVLRHSNGMRGYQMSPRSSETMLLYFCSCCKARGLSHHAACCWARTMLSVNERSTTTVCAARRLAKYEQQHADSSRHSATAKTPREAGW